MKQVFFIVIFFITIAGYTQDFSDTIQLLDEVIVKADRNLEEFSNTQTVSSLKDSVLTRSTASLTDLLKANTTIYFKENGLGMVSSPSFRGTTAQQTAVVWNGININSQFNGQTDFNTINIRNYNAVSVRSGGGSVLYGSGAIGGSIHLDNILAFNTGFNNNVFIRYGSFNTEDVSYTLQYANKKLSVNAGASYLHSSNDYAYVNSDLNNKNGQFYNVGTSVSMGYVLNPKNSIKFYSTVFNGERHFSLTIPTETPTKYYNLNARNMLEWNGAYGKFISDLKVAHLYESYKYFANTASRTFTFGHANTFVGNYQLGYQGLKSVYIKGVLDATQTIGQGSSIPKNKRSIYGASLLFKQQIKKFLYEATLRKEITNNYESPFLFSLGLQYKFGTTYTLNVNASKNFRIPTYNDLYWADSGNLDLNPETAYQFEIGNHINLKKLSVSLTGFYNDISDMIRWVPTGSNWRPINTAQVTIYGLEAQLAYAQALSADSNLNFQANYTYTQSTDKNTSKQLVYVPYHKAFALLNYYKNRLSAYWQSNYTGQVFILSDNNPNYILNDYWVHDLGLEYKLGKHKHIVVGGQIKNVFNKNYQSLSQRFMPGINYNFYLNYNF